MSDLYVMDNNVHYEGALEADFEKEQDIAPAPSCSALGIPSGKTTICASG